MGDTIEYAVEKIIGKRMVNDKKEYKIKWENYSMEESTWEPIENLTNSQKLVKEFDMKYNKEISKEVIEEVDEITNISIKQILTVQDINDQLYAIIRYKKGKENKLKKGLLRTEILARLNPNMLIEFYENNAKFDYII